MTTPQAAYAAMTASSRLQHLNISECALPAGAWQHMFPAGRQLPQLQEFNIKVLKLPSRRPGLAPEGTRLAVAAALQRLDVFHVPYGCRAAGPTAGAGRAAPCTRTWMNLCLQTRMVCRKHALS
jgi:hypothetical protein